jgi:hypothetical protein
MVWLGTPTAGGLLRMTLAFDIGAPKLGAPIGLLKLGFPLGAGDGKPDCGA